MTSVIFQERFMTNRTEHSVTAHTPGTISVCHSNYDGYVSVSTHLPVADAINLRDLLTAAIDLFAADGVLDESLVSLNDDGKTFAEIAAIIRESPSEYFTNLDGVGDER